MKRLMVGLILCAGLRLDAAETSAYSAYLKDICEWILTLDVGSGRLKNTKDTPWSIFINGNLARVLMAGYQITGNRAYLDEALRWSDTFVQQQQIVITSTGEEGGYWADAGKQGNIYFGDAGTAATALALGYRFAAPARQQLYMRALDRYVRFVRQGSISDPQQEGRGAAAGWLIRDGEDRGALGTGYYKGHLSPQPYTVSTATTAASFFAQFYALTRRPEIAQEAAAAAAWLLKIQKPEGGIPYIIDGTRQDLWPLAVMTYCGEGFIGVHTLVEDPRSRARIASGLKPSIEWLLQTQKGDGTWGEPRSPDQQRSAGVVSLLSWYHREVNPDPRVAEAVSKYFSFLLNPENSRAYGVRELVRTTGFVGLAVAETLRPGITFRAGLGPREAPRTVVSGGGYFPVMIRLASGEALAVVRGGGAHMGRAGRLDLVKSADGGKTWSQPWTAVDGPGDDRNPAFGQLKDGTLLLAYAILSGYEADGVHVSRDRKKWFFDGVYVVRSTDQGRTWSKPVRSPAIHKFYAGQGAVSPFGKIIQLRDGTVVMAVYFEFFDQRGNESYIFRSKDGGRTWAQPALLGKGYNETAVEVLPGGPLLAAMRSEKGGHIAVTHSADKGSTWSEPVVITRDSEHPGDLIALASGEVLLTYGQRNRPFGVHAVLSKDGGKTWDWSRRMILASDAPYGDCGYPSSVEVTAGRILTMYYQVDDMENAPASAKARIVTWDVLTGSILLGGKED